VIGLARDVKKAQRTCPFPARWYLWPSADSPLPDLASEDKIDAVLSLLGEPVAETRWNDSIKNEIRSSRTEGTKHLANFVRQRRIATFVSAFTEIAATRF
jgi:NAD dependent epimerase/dehydratase family enzyme